MILPDVNLLVYAVDATSPNHERARRWWDDTLSSSTTVGLC
jgi:predicted nucleic acid-binding protein